MLEIASGIILAVIILAFFPYIVAIGLYLLPPLLGVVIGGIIGAIVAGGDGLFAGALIGLLGGIGVDIALARE